MIRDLRAYARQTTTRLIIIGVLLILVVGIGLIYLVYGPSAALSGLLCMGLGLLPIFFIFLFFTLLEWIVKRANRD